MVGPEVVKMTAQSIILICTCLTVSTIWLQYCTCAIMDVICDAHCVVEGQPLKWQLVEQKGDIPSARESPTLTYV